MKKIISKTLLASSLMVSMMAPAFAEFTVTITNSYPSTAIQIWHVRSKCINNAYYFDKTIPANSSIQVHAKWKDTTDCTTALTTQETMDNNWILITGSNGHVTFDPIYINRYQLDSNGDLKTSNQKHLYTCGNMLCID